LDLLPEDGIRVRDVPERREARSLNLDSQLKTGPLTDLKTTAAGGIQQIITPAVCSAILDDRVLI
jgi:hypothetical protein